MDRIKTIKNSLSNIKEIKDIRTSPIVQSTLLSPLKAIPIIGDLIDSTTENLLDEFQKKKEQELIDIIFSDTERITTEMVNDVEFIVNFNRTLEVVKRLATNDKIKYFGNLIKNGYMIDKHIENSIFEEYLNLLNGLSYREICLLVDFKKWSDKYDSPPNINNWKKFKEKYASKYKISYTVIEDIFIKMAQMGFIKIIYKQEKTITLGRNKKKTKRTTNNNKISEVYDIYLTVYFSKFYKYVLKET